MGQQEIAKLLKNNYPEYMCYEDIIEKTGLSKGSVMRCIRALRQRDEVQLKIIRGNKPKAGWKNFYRIKEEI